MPTSADLSPLITDRFPVDRHFVTSALLEGILTPVDLDPTSSTHLDGFLDALRTQPTLPTPESLLAHMKAHALWEFAALPAVAAHLAAAIRAQEWAANDWNSLPYDPSTGFPLFPSNIPRLTAANTPRPLLPIIQEALLEHFTRGPLYEPLLHYALSHGWFSPEAEKTLASRRRSAGAKKAAATRRQRLSEPPPDTPSPAPVDTLQTAIAEADLSHVDRFALETLQPARLQAALPGWLAAPANIRSRLVRVPGLPAEIRVIALNAWAEHSWGRPTPAEPIPPDLLLHLAPTTVAQLLHADLQGHHHFFQPPLDPQHLTTALLRVALHDPADAAWIQDGFHLQDWFRHLKELADLPPPLTPQEDPEARWLRRLCSEPSRVSRDAALTLCTLFHSWSTDRQRALARPLCKLPMHQYLRTLQS